MTTESRYLELASVAGVEGIRSVGSKESLLAETVCVYETRLGIRIPMDSHPISLLDPDSGVLWIQGILLFSDFYNIPSFN